MKKLWEIVKRQEERKKARDAARWKEWLTLSTKRKCAIALTWVAAGALLMLGLAYSFFFSAILLAAVALWFEGILRSGWKKGARKHVTSALIPCFYLVLVAALAGFFAPHFFPMDFRETRARAERFQEKISQDVALFVEDFSDGHLRGKYLEMDWEVGGAENDRFGRHLLKAGFHAGAMWAGDPDDVSAAFPIVDMLFADKTVYLYSPAAKAADEERRSAIGEEGESSEEAYLGMYLLTCVLDNRGQVMTMLGMPEGMGVELLKIEAAKPLAEVCGAFSADKAAPNGIVLADGSLDE